MGAPAISTPAPETTPASAPETPAVAPSAAPAPSGAPGEGEARGEPGKPPEAAPAQEHQIPWAKFREAQTQSTQLKRQLAQAEQKYQAEVQKLQKGLQENSRYKDDFTSLEQLLNDNPDIAEMMQQRVGKGGAMARPGSSQAVLPPEFSKLTTEVQELRNMMAAQRQAQQQAAQQAEDARLGEQLNGVVTKFLGERQYETEKFLPDARAYVLWRVGQMPDPTMEDVPFLLQEWWKREEGKKQHWLQSLRTGKQADAALPATPGPTNGNAVAAVPPGGLSPDEASTALVQKLKERGWQ